MTTAPRITVVTTNFNGAAYLETAIRSVVEQDYPNLEYIVIDGGSTDGSVEIIKRYENRISYWESEPDRGFAHAYNKGFSRATGDILAYLNSDDIYCPWALSIVGRCFADIPEIEWLTSLYPAVHSSELGFVHMEDAQPFDPGLFYAGFYGNRRNYIQQESTFWSHSLWTKAGGNFDESLKLAIDVDLWARFANHATLYSVATPLGGFRQRHGSKSNLQPAEYHREFEQIIAQESAKSANKPRLSAATLNPVARTLVNTLPLSLLPKSLRCTGPVIDWNFDKGKYEVLHRRIKL